MTIQRQLDPTYCKEWVSEVYTHHQCQRRWVVERDGHRYCHQHDPEAVKARHAKRDAAWDAKWAEERAVTEARAHKLATWDVLYEALKAVEGSYPLLPNEVYLQLIRALAAAEKGLP